VCVSVFSRSHRANCGSSCFLYTGTPTGMGLNLAIGRVIFSALEKFDGKVDRRLSDAEIKQIAGRAGRFNGKFQVGGEG